MQIIARQDICGAFWHAVKYAEAYPEAYRERCGGALVIGSCLHLTSTVDLTPPLTGARPFKPTTLRCPLRGNLTMGWQTSLPTDPLPLTPARAQTYLGNFVQTTWAKAESTEHST